MIPKKPQFHWFRLHHGMITDPKWRVVGRKSGTRVCEVIAVVTYLMERASQSDDRGSIAAYDADEIGCALDLDAEAVEAIVQALRDKGYIEDERIANWSKYQPLREDDSKERVKEYRERQKAKRNGNEEEVTPCNAPVTQCNADDVAVTLEERRGEKRREENTPLPPHGGNAGTRDDQAIECRKAIMQAFEKAGVLIDTSRVNVWIEQGYQPGMILAVIRDRLSRGKPPRSLSYFDPMLAEAVAASAPAHAAPEEITDRMWRHQCRQFRELGKWPYNSDRYGPQPGRPGCKVPSHILAEFGLMEAA